MLVLTRSITKCVNVDIEVGGKIIRTVVKVLGVNGCQVRLGFTAPLNVKILRQELEQDNNNGQQLSPEQQARESLNKIINRKANRINAQLPAQ